MYPSKQDISKMSVSELTTLQHEIKSHLLDLIDATNAAQSDRNIVAQLIQQKSEPDKPDA